MPPAPPDVPRPTTTEGDTRASDRASALPEALVAGRYRVEAVLGRGGMATVYRATHAVTGRRVALKRLHPRPDWSPSEVERLLREARIATRLGNPHVAEVYDAGLDDDGAPFLAMELLEGDTLRARLERDGPLAPDEAVRVARAVLSALAAAHAAGVVHRDVKPENVFLARAPDATPRVLLLDFGVSKVLRAHAGTLAPHSLTETGAVVGTVAYMSPEQLRAEDVDARADLWAVGAMLYEMLAGRAPFTGRTAALLTMAILMRRAPPLDRAVEGLPRPLVALVSQLLSPDRAQRPSDAADALRALDALPSLPPPAALTRLAPPPDDAPEAPARPRRRALVVAVTAALTAAAALGLARPRASTTARPAPTAPAANAVHWQTPAPRWQAPAHDAGVDARAALAASPPPVAATPPRRATPRLAPRPAARPTAPAAGAAGPAPMQPATELDGT